MVIPTKASETQASEPDLIKKFWNDYCKENFNRLGKETSTHKLKVNPLPSAIGGVCGLGIGIAIAVPLAPVIIGALGVGAIAWASTAITCGVVATSGLTGGLTGMTACLIASPSTSDKTDPKNTENGTPNNSPQPAENNQSFFNAIFCCKAR